jgi:hypothetical protein
MAALACAAEQQQDTWQDYGAVINFRSLAGSYVTSVCYRSGGVGRQQPGAAAMHSALPCLAYTTVRATACRPAHSLRRT